jgi:hypothetical protein
MAVDFTALEASISTLDGSCDKLIAEKQAVEQTAQTGVDAAKTAVDAVTTKVVAAS